MHLLAPYRHRTGSSVACAETAPQGPASTLLDRPGPEPVGGEAGSAHRPAAPGSPGGRARRFAGVIRAWMVVLPVDAVLLLTPLLWAPQQRKAIVTMAVLALLLVTGGGRYRARLHLSVLDELPTLLGRLLTAAAVVATVIALRHEQESVTTFLVNAAIAIGLVVVGRVGDHAADRLGPATAGHRAPHAC